MKRFMKATAAALVATTALGGAAFAGSLQDPVIETPVIAPAPVPVSG